MTSIFDIGSGSYIYEPVIVIDKTKNISLDDEGFRRTNCFVTVNPNMHTIKIPCDSFYKIRVNDAISIKRLIGQSGIVWSEDVVD